tara:strand:+ start:45051 stop:45785 length:735 start_codon:yes stop_codon:yes gene_type:complete
MYSFPKNKKKPQLFEGLSEESLQTLLQHSFLKEFENGQLLIQQGDIPQFVYLIIDGTLKTSRMSAEGEEATIRLLESGDVCMEAVLFMGGPSPIDVQAMGTTTVLLIPDKVIKTHVLEDARFSVNLLKIVTRHYKNAMHQIDAMQIKSPVQRVGYYFLIKHLESGHDSLEFSLPFRKQSIASYLGMTPETFSRTLKKMKEMGIEVEDDKIKMRDSFTLCHFCDSDTAALCARHDREECQQCPLH